MTEDPKDKLTRVTGTYREAKDVTARLKWCETECNLVSPATHVGSLPEGCGIAMSVLHVDIDNETYDTGGGKRGLHKVVLQKMAAQLGISWDDKASGRIDDGSDPYYCRWKAVGSYRAFDGSIQGLLASKQLDLRDGSPTVVALHAQAQNKERGNADKQIREMRNFIQEHAETKAQLRAIRSLGIKTSYKVAELKKPFVAARIMWTGHSDDPEMRRMFAEKTADSFLSGRRALYAQAPAEQETTHARLPPPPIATQDADFDDDDDDDDFDPETGEVKPTTSSSAPAAAAPKGGWVIPGGNAKNTPLEKAELRDLEYWANRIGKDLLEGTSRDEGRDKSLHAAMVQEIQQRSSKAAPASKVADKPAAAKEDKQQTEAKF
jgi:hypothetical protein